MALIPKFTVCPKRGCSVIIFNETTGVYDADLNVGGYGAPNPVVGDATTWSIIVTLTDDTIVTITDPVGLPTSNGDLEYEITAEALDLDIISDGLYTIEYTVTVGATTYTSGTQYFLFTCNIECCIDKMFAKIPSTSCECDSTVIKNALYARALLLGLKANANCGDADVINDLLTKLNKICGFSESNCGCN